MDVWHITIPGAPDSPFSGGKYHFKLTLDEYPGGPPDIEILNNNGSFIPNVKICIESLTKYHRNKWSPVPVIEIAETL